MHFARFRFFTTLTFVVFFVHLTLGDNNYFLKAAKNVPRIGRSNSNKNSNIDEMGKFFMKASKSVPRIGRRQESFENAALYKREQMPAWNDIADKFEYDPELFGNPEILEQMQMGDDPLASYQWEQGRNKRESENPKFKYLKYAMK